MYEHTDYRFTVNTEPYATTPTITRGRAYQLPSDWCADSWSHYWDGTDMVAFIDGDYRDGIYPVKGCDNDETDRAIAAFKAEQDTLTGSSDGLHRLAKRLTDNPDAKFICVGLDRGTDLYALSWDGDPSGDWAREIEAVNYGDIWRIEVEEFQPGMGMGGGDWVPCDEYSEEFYGEDKALAEFARIFEMAEFPAEMMIEASA